MKHRKEEDDLYRRFAKKREDEERRMANEIQDEWERELQVSEDFDLLEPSLTLSTFPAINS